MPNAPREYQVVARRYRPQGFAELVGQEHVAKALTNAIAAGRVGHAYLFTGARGVGKTSTARILAKALNCERGASATPCNECDICLSIGTGDDVDVLEIDGASNRGIDEIRELRQTVSVRPSRSRFKIYIIDEVHMLTREAFNALLKTLEEPPDHVKFIFCTTEAEKIPITILSRCQRYDFAGIAARPIAERLKQIVETEGVEAEPAALELLARRAGGSMRDSQSLLEQLLAFGESKITVADVHSLLGTAEDLRLANLTSRLAERDSQGALNELDAALGEGVDIGQLLEQLLGFYRDLMVAAVGARADLLLYAATSDHPQVVETAKRLGLETILASMQVLDHTLSRLRFSTQPRTLAELALMRIARLENLDEISTWIARLSQDGESDAESPAERRPIEPGPKASGPPPPQDREPRPTGSGVNEPREPRTSGSGVVEPAGFNGGNSQVSSARKVLNPETPAEWNDAAGLAVWEQALSSLGDMIDQMGRKSARVATGAPNRLVVYFVENYTSCKAFCERTDQRPRLERALADFAGRPIQLEFELLVEAGREQDSGERQSQRALSYEDRLAERARHPLVRHAIEIFQAQPVWMKDAES